MYTRKLDFNNHTTHRTASKLGALLLNRERMGEERKREKPQAGINSKRTKASNDDESAEPKIVAVMENACKVSVPRELLWITEELGETDPLVVFDFVPSGLAALVTELNTVFPGGPAPNIFTKHPFTAASTKRNILDYLASINPAPTGNYTQVHGCMIGPNSGPECGRVLWRIASFQVEVTNLGLNPANLITPIARPYAIHEGRANVLLQAVGVGAGVAGVFIG